VGLDTQAVRQTHDGFEDVDAEQFGDYFEYGGYFRGKLYNNLVEKVTGVSLYNEYIPPAIVSEMYGKIHGYYHIQKFCSQCDEDYVDGTDLEFLYHFFGVCHESNLGLRNDW